MVQRKPPKPNIAMIGVGTIFTSMVLSGFIIGYALDVWLDTTRGSC